MGFTEWPLSPNLSCLSHLPTYQRRQHQPGTLPECPESRIIKAYEELGYPVNCRLESLGKKAGASRVAFRCSEWASAKTLRTSKHRCEYRCAVVQRYGDYFLQWDGKHNHDPYLEAGGQPETDPSGASVGILHRPKRFRFVEARTPLSSRTRRRDQSAARALQASSTQRKHRADIPSRASAGIRFVEERPSLSSSRERHDHSAARPLQSWSTQRKHRADIPSRASAGIRFVEERPSLFSGRERHDHSAARPLQPWSTQRKRRANIPTEASVDIRFVEKRPSPPSGRERHDHSAAAALRPLSTQHMYGVTILTDDTSLDDHVCQILRRDKDLGYPLVVGERSDKKEGQDSSCVLRCNKGPPLTTQRTSETWCEYKAIVYSPYDGKYYLQISGEHNHPPTLRQ